MKLQNCKICSKIAWKVEETEFYANFFIDFNEVILKIFFCYFLYCCSFISGESEEKQNESFNHYEKGEFCLGYETVHQTNSCDECVSPVSNRRFDKHSSMIEQKNT